MTSNKVENVEEQPMLTAEKHDEMNAKTSNIQFCSGIQRTTFNIRGIRYELNTECLSKFKDSKFHHLPPRHYDVWQNEYYFNRDPYLFNTVINFLVDGTVHITDNTMIESFENELEFWGLTDQAVFPPSYLQRQKEEGNVNQVKTDKNGIDIMFLPKIKPHWKENLKTFLEKPTSRPAKVWIC